MEIQRIDLSDEQSIRRFILFPFLLYKGNKRWVPPLLAEIRTVFNEKEHPFYRHSVACFFLAREDNDVRGCLAVLNNRHYNEFHRTKTAFFYFFEAIDDYQVAQALFEEAFRWTRAQGLEKIMGPMGFCALDGRGVLVEGFGFQPATGIPYNLPYYPLLLSSVGFRKKTDFLSGFVTNPELPEKIARVAERVKKRRHIWIKSFKNKREMKDWIPSVREIYNQAFVRLEDHYPMTDEEIRLMAQRLLFIADPRLIKLMMKGDKPIGFILAYPNITRGIQQAKGRIWPFGWLHLIWDIHRSRWLDFNGIAILPQYQGLGANVLLYLEMVKSVQERGAILAEAIQIEESNVPSLSEAQLFDVNWCKRHRIYVREV